MTLLAAAHSLGVLHQALQFVLRHVAGAGALVGVCALLVFASGGRESEQR